MPHTGSRTHLPMGDSQYPVPAGAATVLCGRPLRAEPALVKARTTQEAVTVDGEEDMILVSKRPLVSDSELL